MNTDIFRFSVGTFECIAIRDWLAKYENPVPLLFFKAPKDHLKQVLREYGILLKGLKFQDSVALN